MIMKFLIFCVAVFSVFISTCSDKRTEKNDILTTIYPLEMITKEIAGDLFTVSSFIPANSSPHTYSPLPSDIIKLESANLVISVGYDLEVNLKAVLDAMENKHLRVSDFLNLEASVSTNKAQKCCPNHNHDHHDSSCSADSHHHHIDYAHGDSHKKFVNPHIWTDPEIIIDIARVIKNRLIAKQEEKAEFFQDNFLKFTDKMMSVDNQIKKERSEIGKINIITFHNAFYYFNKRYDINLSAVIAESPGKEPSARYLAEIGDIIKRDSIKTILIEPQLNPKSAQILAEEFSLNMELVDPLGNYFKSETIDEFILQNWRIIKKSVL